MCIWDNIYCFTLTLLPTNVSAPENVLRFDLSSDIQDVRMKPMREASGRRQGSLTPGCCPRDSLAQASFQVRRGLMQKGRGPGQQGHTCQWKCPQPHLVPTALAGCPAPCLVSLPFAAHSQPRVQPPPRKPTAAPGGWLTT